MTRTAAEVLVNTHEGRLCKMLYRRSDGTVLTRDCPVGMRQVRRRLARAVTAMAVVLGFLTFGVLYTQTSGPNASASGPLAKLAVWVHRPDLSRIWGW